MNILLLLAGLAVLGFIIWDSVSSRRFERRKAIRACIDMANRYDADIGGCDSEDLIAYSEGISCSYRLAYIIKYGTFPTSHFPLDKEFKTVAKELLDEQNPEIPYVAMTGEVPTEIQTCTRPLPHICCVNGPCNGFPKETPDDNDALRSWPTQNTPPASGGSNA